MLFISIILFILSIVVQVILEGLCFPDWVVVSVGLIIGYLSGVSFYYWIGDKNESSN